MAKTKEECVGCETPTNNRVALRRDGEKRFRRKPCCENCEALYPEDN